MSDGGDRLLKPSEVAKAFGVSVKAVARWSDSGELPAIRTPGGHRRFRSHDVRRLLAALTQDAPD